MDEKSAAVEFLNYLKILLDSGIHQDHVLSVAYELLRRKYGHSDGIIPDGIRNPGLHKDLTETIIQSEPEKAPDSVIPIRSAKVTSTKK
jgi:hypothetical protein